MNILRKMSEAVRNYFESGREIDKKYAGLYNEAIRDNSRDRLDIWDKVHEITRSRI
ncbi:hypothetical protein GW923_00815 [Candidatus Pacearchaeota archaeon]|nr:hypothetical protein [Candidatus Pacearchaeota archaeon]